MRFKKILTIELPLFKLDNVYWDKIDELSEKRINLSKDSTKTYHEIVDADCILTGFGIRVGKEEIDHAHSLKYIGVLATGYGGIDVKYSKSKNVTVTNIPGYATEAVAEFVFGLILNHIRELEKGNSQARNGNYSEAGFKASEIKDKKFGIIGLGRIGMRVAEIASGFGANVSYWSRNRKKDAEKKGIRYESIDRLLATCDFISLHLLYTKETKGILDKNRINSIKKGALFINVAPMELINFSALEKRLKKGDITFIFDHPDEMDKKDVDTLSQYKNCSIYPPIGYITKEASEAKQEIFVDNLESFLKGKPINRVN